MVAPVKEMKWMILGGEGQLARAMSLELSRIGADFISFSREQIDITNQTDIEKCFKKVSPDIVFNAAGWTDVDLAETNTENARLVNATAPKMLATACAEIGAKCIHISTDYVFSGIATSAWSENAEKLPISAYGRTKAEGEDLVLDVYPQGSFIVRTSWLYSPWGGNFVKTMAKIALQESRNVEVVNDQFGQPTSATDLAKQVRQMIFLNLPPGIYHGTNSGQTNWFEFARKIFELMGEDLNRVIAVDSSRFPRLAKRPAFSVLGHDHWISEGLTPMRNWQDALEDALPAILQTIK